MSEKEYKRIKASEKATKDKNVSRWLRVLMLRYEGSTTTEAAEAGQEVTAICRLTDDLLKSITCRHWI